ncbi:S8 family serine peptidase [Jatrophihabitans sp. YIM 134969]
MAVTLTAVGLTVPFAASSTAAPAVPAGLPAAAAAQIDALTAAKNARTPAQRKISSQLLTAVAQRQGGRVASGVGPLTTTAAVGKDGTVRVTVAATPTGRVDSIAKEIDAAGGRVHSIWKTSVDADVPASALTALAGSAAVRRIDPTGGATLAGVTPNAPRATVQQQVAAAAATPAKAGSVVDEGDVALAANAARKATQVRGAGITVGVLSDGVDSLAGSIASGDLPANTRVLDGQEGSGDEGTAMLEIVHDVAPTANLLFATAFESAESFADNIRALRAAGADVIVDDVIYYAENPFQDTGIAAAVRDVTADGAAYFSSAGNQGNVTDGTSGNWEGDFVDSGQTIGKFKGVAHDFAPASVVQASDPLSSDSAGTVTTLFWADPAGKARDDYDLYVVDASGAVVAASNDTQDGDDDPFEVLQVPSGSGLRVAVVKYKGAAKYLQVTTFGGRFESGGGLKGYVTPGVIRGHAAVPAAYAVAAVPAADPLPFAIKPGLANPSGPYPGTYKSSQKSEVFTSDGPRRVFFQPDGTPITPGDTSATGGTVRSKPDLTSADGVNTSVTGFAPFFGTSAAAPHAAALAALALSGNRGLSPAALRSALTTNAIDIEKPGYDRDTGFGITMANRLLTATGATPQPLVTAGDPTVVPAGDGDAYLEPGESAKVTVPLTNAGDGTAANISVTVTSTDATVSPATRQVTTIGPGQTRTVNFTIAVPASQEPGDPVELAATVRFTGALSPTTRTLSVPVGQPSAPRAFAYTGPAVPIPDSTPAGVDVPVQVTGVGTVSGVTFSLDGSDCSTGAGSGIEHTYDGDLIGTLTAPDGTEVTLFSRTGGTGENFCQTVFTDAATTPIQGQPLDAAPFTGQFKPAEPLSTLDGVNANGTWTFTVSDNAGADTGTLRAFTLNVAGYVAAG